MRLQFIILFLSLSSFAKTYTLSELQELALKNSFEAKKNETELNKASVNIDSEKSDYYPKVELVTGLEYADNEGNDYLNGDNFLAEARLEYDIFQFGKTSNKVAALRKYKTQQKKLTKLTKFDTQKIVEELYLKTLYFQELEAIFKQELEVNRNIMKQVSFRKKQSLVGEADVLEIEMRYASLIAKLNESLAASEFYRGRLKQLTFIPYESKLNIKDNIKYKKVIFDTKTILSEFKESNTELIKINSSIEMKEFELESAKSERLPSLKLKARYGKMRVDDKYSLDDKVEGLAGIYLEIPITDGGKRSSRSTLKKIEIAHDRAKLDYTTHMVSLRLRQKLSRLGIIDRHIKHSKENVKKGFKYYKTVSDEYTRGVKNSMDLVSAREKYLEFKVDYLTEKKKYELTKLEIEKLLGRNL